MPREHPSTFLPSQTNIPTFCYQQTPTIITTDTLLIILRPYSSQLTPLNRDTPFEKGDLIQRTGTSTNPKPTYSSLLSLTLRSPTPCPTHSSSALQKLGIPNHVVFAFVTNSGMLTTCPQSRTRITVCTKPHGHTQSINCNFIP